MPFRISVVSIPQFDGSQLSFELCQVIYVQIDLHETRFCNLLAKIPIRQRIVIKAKGGLWSGFECRAFGTAADTSACGLEEYRRSAWSSPTLLSTYKAIPVQSIDKVFLNRLVQARTQAGRRAESALGRALHSGWNAPGSLGEREEFSAKRC